MGCIYIFKVVGLQYTGFACIRGNSKVMLCMGLLVNLSLFGYVKPLQYWSEYH